MRLKLEIEGMGALTKQLTNLRGGSDDVMANVINKMMFGTQARAVRAIQSGPATGRIYKRGNRTHQASAPGEFPMSDTGQLASSVQVEPATRGRLLGAVGTAVMHGRHLEFGTERMVARPWLLPSFEAQRVDVEDDLKRELESRI